MVEETHTATQGAHGAAQEGLKELANWITLLNDRWHDIAVGHGRNRIEEQIGHEGLDEFRKAQRLGERFVHGLCKHFNFQADPGAKDINDRQSQ